MNRKDGGFRMALFLGFLLPLSGSGETLEDPGTGSPPPQLNLLVVDVIPAPQPYADFCGRNPRECVMTGPDVIVHSRAAVEALQRANLSVNAEIGFALDRDQYGEEEHWAYPRSGFGDCEDKALEKRRRLADEGYPRAALRLAIVQHRVLLSSHCVLTAETTEGTYILDSWMDRVPVWHEAPYNFESRERTDGWWERFDQGVWSYPPPDR